MDPNAILAAAIERGSATVDECRDYNTWVLNGGFKGETHVWSNRVFGVPVHATVDRMRRTKMVCQLSYGGATWRAELPYGRAIDAPAHRENVQ